MFDELAELTGQRNAVDARIVDIVAEIDRDGLWSTTGCRSVSALVAWKTGTSTTNANTIATVAHRLAQFPRCASAMAEGRLSLDQLGVIAARAADGSDKHYEQLARNASVTQLRTAVKLEPRPEPAPRPAPEPSISKSSDEHGTYWRIRLGVLDAATFDAALKSHRDKLIAEWRRNRERAADEDPYADADPNAPRMTDLPAPMPSTLDAFVTLIEAGWDADVAARPHGQHTTVIAHVDVDTHIGALHLGPLLSDADRQYLSCDATCEVWFNRHGQPIGAARATRIINRRLRRALEHRHPTCVVPGCGATRGLHAHHIRHWEDGGATDLDNLVLVCPYHHRLHHQGRITITGPANTLRITDHNGNILTHGSLARPPTKPPPAVPPWRGTSGERCHWWWYDPYEPQPPPSNN